VYFDIKNKGGQAVLRLFSYSQEVAIEYPHTISWDGLITNLGRALEKIYGEGEMPQSVLDYTDRKMDKLNMFID